MLFKVQLSVFFVFTLLTLKAGSCLNLALGEKFIGPSSANQNVSNTNSNTKSILKYLPVINLSSKSNTNNIQGTLNKLNPITNGSNTTESNKIASNVIKIENKSKISALNGMESGTVVRFLVVFVGLAVLFKLYSTFRNYRNSRLRRQTPIVKKYGVRTRRNDVEMTPLPLDDDDEDEIVFQVGNVTDH